MSTAPTAGRDVREWQRIRAWELHRKGCSGRDIAEALKVSAGAVSGWLKRGRADGVAALRRRSAPGRVPKLTATQRARLPDLLAKGAEACGFISDV